MKTDPQFEMEQRLTKLIQDLFQRLQNELPGVAAAAVSKQGASEESIRGWIHDVVDNNLLTWGLTPEGMEAQIRAVVKAELQAQQAESFAQTISESVRTARVADRIEWERRFRAVVLRLERLEGRAAPLSLRGSGTIKEKQGHEYVERAGVPIFSDQDEFWPQPDHSWFPAWLRIGKRDWDRAKPNRRPGVRWPRWKPVAVAAMIAALIFVGWRMMWPRDPAPDLPHPGISPVPAPAPAPIRRPQDPPEVRAQDYLQRVQSAGEEWRPLIDRIRAGRNTTLVSIVDRWEGGGDLNDDQRKRLHVGLLQASLNELRGSRLTIDGQTEHTRACDSNTCTAVRDYWAELPGGLPTSAAAPPGDYLLLAERLIIHDWLQRNSAR